MTRAERRYKSKVAKNKAKRLLKLLMFEKEHIDSKLIGKYAKTRKPCSCSICANPRNKNSWEKIKWKIGDRRILEGVKQQENEQTNLV